MGYPSLMKKLPNIWVSILIADLTVLNMYVKLLLRPQRVPVFLNIYLNMFLEKCLTCHINCMSYPILTTVMSYTHDQRSDLMNLIEQVQYTAALIVSGCWQGTSREKLYE